MQVHKIAELLKELQTHIADDHRASDDPDDETPATTVTVSTSSGESWNYQTGDNSFSGACYGDRHWSVQTLTRDSNTDEMAAEIVHELYGLIHEESVRAEIHDITGR